MKKIFAILSAALLTACSNYGYVRNEESNFITTSPNSDPGVIIIQRTSPTIYPYTYPYPYQYTYPYFYPYPYYPPIEPRYYGIPKHDYKYRKPDEPTHHTLHSDDNTPNNLNNKEHR